MHPILLKLKNMTASRNVKTKTTSRSKEGVFLTLPALVVILATVIYPIGWSFKISLFSSEDGLENTSFIGLENYIKVLSSNNFLNALIHTFGFVVTTLIVELIIGFAAALVLNRSLPGHTIFRL